MTITDAAAAAATSKTRGKGEPLWDLSSVLELFELPFSDLMHRAQTVHREHFDPNVVQLSTLLSIKTGGCPEDCAYCPQSLRYQTGVRSQELLPLSDVVDAARRAKEAGATRFCMGAAWREVTSGKDFDRVLEMVTGVRALGLEACCTLGMLTQSQADALAGAGLTAYNHNLDTSPEFYGQIITTRTYQDRLQTLARVRRAGITVCCGGIIGLGEERRDRWRLLQQLATLTPHPESVPINLLVRVEGTPLDDRTPEDPLELVRVIATSRILMPAAFVRLSAGRLSLSEEAQALCFLAGANSVFLGDRLLTTPNPPAEADRRLFERLGLRLQVREPAPVSADGPNRSPTSGP
jgi:biotin synthase